MGKFAHVVIGPAGVGKSTFIFKMYDHCLHEGKSVYCINLDPGAETCEYPVTINICEFMTQEKMMDVKDIGPNGALIECLQYVTEEYMDKFTKEIDQSDDAYVFIDCPGQIELYTHLFINSSQKYIDPKSESNNKNNKNNKNNNNNNNNITNEEINPIIKFIQIFKDFDYTVTGIFILDIAHLVSVEKFISSSLACLSAMITFQLPWTSVVTKMDLLKVISPDLKPKHINKLLDGDYGYFINEIEKNESNPKLIKLSKLLLSILEEEGLVQFLPINYLDPNMVQNVISHIDRVCGYEKEEPDEKDYDPITNLEDGFQAL